MHLKWMALSAVKNLKSVTFWMLLASFVMLSSLLSFLEISRKGSNRVLVFAAGSEKAEEIMADLMSDEHHGFDFEMADSADELKEQVLRSEALAGIEFTEKFDETIETGKMEKSIVLYSPPDSAVSTVLPEILFPCILRHSSPMMLDEYMEDNGIGKDTRNAVIKTNDRITGTWNVGLFSLTEVAADNGAAEPVRSYMRVIELLLFVAVFVMSVCEEKKAHRDFLMARSRSDRIRFMLEGAAVRTVLLAVLMPVMKLIGVITIR